MNKELWLAQHALHERHSAKFTKPTPRTAREAFGCEFEYQHDEVDTWVFIVVMVALVVGFGVVSWL